MEKKDSLFGHPCSQGLPTVGKRDIKEGLDRLGIRRGDVLLVHSSLSRFGYVDGGADEVIDALMGAVSSEGTLMMSAITTSAEFVARCIEAAQKGESADVPPFDPDGTPTWAGTIAEAFRKRPGVMRSLHPTHSVSAWGSRAEEMIAGHENAPGPCGAGTPYLRLTDGERGFVLLMGVNHQSNTTLHGFEELFGCEYVLYPEVCRIPVKTSAGVKEARTRVHLPHLNRHLGILETAFVDGMAQTVTHVGGSPLRCVNGKAMRKITLDALRRDPFLFLTEKGRETYRKMKESGGWMQRPK